MDDEQQMPSVRVDETGADPTAVGEKLNKRMTRWLQQRENSHLAPINPERVKVRPLTPRKIEERQRRLNNRPAGQKRPMAIKSNLDANKAREARQNAGDAEAHQPQQAEPSKPSRRRKMKRAKRNPSPFSLENLDRTILQHLGLKR